MKREQAAILLVIILGILPTIVLADSINVDIPVVVTWENYVIQQYDDSIPNWKMYIDLELRCDHWNDVITQTIATGIEPFREVGRGQVAGPFVVGWPGGLKDTAQVYGRVRWHENESLLDEMPNHDIIGDWTYIQSITGTEIILYFPLALKASD